MGMGFRFEQHRLGLWDFELGFENKTISWEMGLGPPFTTLMAVNFFRLNLKFFRLDTSEMKFFFGSEIVRV